MDWKVKRIFVFLCSMVIILSNLQTSESMKFKTNNSLRGLTVNVSWAPQGGSMKYTMKMHPMRCGMPDDVNKIREEVTESDSIIMRDLAYDCDYNTTLFATNLNDPNSGSMMKETAMFQSPATPVAESGSNGYEAEIYLLYHQSASHYHIIVRKLKNNENGTTLNRDLPTNQIGQDELTAYEDGTMMYITRNVTQNETSGGNIVIRIGDGQTDHAGLLNAKLESDTRYSFFQRTFFKNATSQSYEWMDAVKTKPSTAQLADDGLNETEIAIITVGVAIGIIVVIFFIVVCCHWKYSRNYAPKPKKKPRSDPVQRQLTDPGIPVTENDFYDHVAQMKFHNFKGFYEEFSKMEIDFKPTEFFRKPENAQRNRFLNVPCYDHSRVVLSQTARDENTYIHANYVPGYDSDRDYILTQSPLPETIKDFWNMIWQNDVTTIVMIGQKIEKGNQVCAPYYPETLEEPVTALYGEVKLDKIHTTADYVVRHLTLVGEDGVTTRKVKHLQFLSWPAVRITPACPTVFLQFMKAVNKAIGRNKDKPIVIHGTTGTGRPGIYACVDSQIRRLRKQGDINVYTAVQDVRESRYDGVKTLDEYIFIHDTVLENILKKNIKDIEVEHLPHYIENTAKNSPGELFVMEYNFLAATAVSAAQKMDVGSQPVNKAKNRYDNVKPFDDNRVKIGKLLNEEGSDYINASYIDTYGSKKSFIATQAPLVGTVGDFWRMVYEQESWVIVMLGQEIEKGHLKADRFWPEEGYVMALGHLTVKFISKQTDSLKDVVLRQVELIHEKDGAKKLVQLYQYLSWPSHEGISSESIHSLVQLVHQSQLWKEKLNAKSITVVSSSGIGRPGVFIALRSLQEESEIEGRVNIFETVQKLRQQRASIIQTREEYILIYTSTMEITKHVRRKSIVAESLADVSKIGLDILPNSLNGSINPSIMERLNSVSQTSQF